jgi:hypothetical protein
MFAALRSGRKYDVIPQNGDCSREKWCAYFGFLKQSPLSKRYVLQPISANRYLVTALRNGNSSAVSTLMYLSDGDSSASVAR